MQGINWKTKNHIIQKFENVSDDFCITLSEQADVQYCWIINNSEISIIIDLEEEWVYTDCYFFVQGRQNQKVSLTIASNFSANNTKALFHIIVLASDNAEIILNGNVHINDWVKHVETRLFEETLLLGKSKYISLIPGLRVESPDVVASHGAKVQRVSPEKLFYMESRGLSEEKSKQILINSYSDYIVEKMNLNEVEKKQFYSLLV